MVWENSPYILPLLIIVFIMGWMVAHAWRNQDTAGAVPFIALSLGVMIWCLSYAIDLLVPDLPTKILWSKIAYLGITTIPIAWLALALQYTQRSKLITRRNLLLASIIPLLTIILVFTNEMHGLVWANVWLEWDMMVEYGNWWWVSFAYSYILIMAGMILFITAYFRSDKLYRGQIGVMILSTFAPWVGNILWVTGNNPIPELDLTPFGFAASAIMYGFGLFRFQLLDIIPIARDRLVETVTDGMLVIDNHGRLMDFNPAALAILKIINPALEKLSLGQTIDSILSPWPELLTLCKEKKSVTNEELDTPSQIVGKHYAFTQSPLTNNRKKTTGYLLILRDITRRKEVEQQLRKLNSDKDRLFSVISHDLRGPFNPVIGFAQLLMTQGDKMDAEEVMETGELIYNSSKSAYELLESLLQWSQLQTGRMPFEPEQLSLSDLLEKSKKLFAGNAHTKKINLEINLVEDIQINADANMIEAVLRNFISNAIKFTPENGTITLSAQQKNNETIVSVTDTGVGIDPEHIAKLFRIDEHLTTKGTANETGTGLGLILCKEFVDRHNGRIWVETQPEKGSSFFFALPAN